MIQYKRLDTPEGSGLKDVLAITDDANAEMAAVGDLIAEFEFDIELPDKPSVEDSNFHFRIPGEMVGEFSEMIEEVDNGGLESCIQIWNAQMIEEAAGDDG